MTPLDAALDLITRGWNPVPVESRSKKPALGLDWHKVVITTANAAQYFNGRDLNIGAQLGAPSRGLTDVDLDAQEAIVIAPYILPRTGSIFGRASARNSHWLYYTELANSVENAAIAFDDPLKRGRLIELRIGGHGKGAQTVVPPSIHKETGEPIRWEENGVPATVNGEELQRHVPTIAAYSLLARYWPPEHGGHHDTARVVGGFIARLGHPTSIVRSHVEGIAKAAGSPRWKELSRTAVDAAQAYADGKHTFGFPQLRKTFGDQIAKQVAEWLGYNDSGDPPDPEPPPPRPEREPIHSWDDPDWSLLEDRRGDLPAFPLDCLNAGWQAWALELAQGAGTTTAHVVLPLLGIASGLIGVARRVQIVRSWIEPIAMWTAWVGLSGTGKTPGLEVTKRALAKIEELRRPMVDKAKRAHEEKADIAKVALKAWKKQVEKALKDGVSPPAKPEDAYDLGPFVAPSLYTSDSTIERVAMLLEARPSGLAYVRDELSALFLNMSRYSGGNDKEFWLEAWNGKSFRQDRVGRKPVSVDYLIVAVVGGLNPDTMARSFEGDLDGSYARVLFAWPEESGYRELKDDVAEIEPAILNALNRLVRLGDAEEGAFAPISIKMSIEARDAFDAHRKRMYGGRAALDGRERDWWCKMPAQVARLAGTLTLLDWALSVNPEPTYGDYPYGDDLDDEPPMPLPDEVDVEHVEAAVRLVETYFWPHARAALRLIGLTERHANARRVLKWIKAHRPKHVSREDVRRDALAQSLDAEQTQALIEDMERAGWLRKTVEKHTGAGRPLVRWEINPQLLR
jgi:hypothetical protein